MHAGSAEQPSGRSTVVTPAEPGWGVHPTSVPVRGRDAGSAPGPNADPQGGYVDDDVSQWSRPIRSYPVKTVIPQGILRGLLFILSLREREAGKYITGETSVAIGVENFGLPLFPFPIVEVPVANHVPKAPVSRCPVAHAQPGSPDSSTTVPILINPVSRRTL